MEREAMRVVLIPGINGSDEYHWQSIWQAEWGPSATRISPSSWDEPELDDWCRAIDLAVDEGRSADVVLVAHSLGCLAAISWAVRPRRRDDLHRARPGATGGPRPDRHQRERSLLHHGRRHRTGRCLAARPR